MSQDAQHQQATGDFVGKLTLLAAISAGVYGFVQTEDWAKAVGYALIGIGLGFIAAHIIRLLITIVLALAVLAGLTAVFYDRIERWFPELADFLRTFFS